jgi:uncharacterized protein YaiI (UPF0178 family)
MRMIIDYDSTPRAQRKVCEAISKEYQIPVEGISGLAADDEHYAEDRKAQIDEVLTMDDIFITDDYDLAQTLLNRALSVISPEGIVICSANIESLLYERFLKTRHPSKPLSQEAASRRHHDEIERFTTILLDLIAPLNTEDYQ